MQAHHAPLVLSTITAHVGGSHPWPWPVDCWHEGGEGGAQGSSRISGSVWMCIFSISETAAVPTVALQGSIPTKGSRFPTTRTLPGPVCSGCFNGHPNGCAAPSQCGPGLWSLSDDAASFPPLLTILVCARALLNSLGRLWTFMVCHRVEGAPCVFWTRVCYLAYYLTLFSSTMWAVSPLLFLWCTSVFNFHEVQFTFPFFVFFGVKNQEIAIKSDDIQISFHGFIFFWEIL